MPVQAVQNMFSKLSFDVQQPTIKLLFFLLSGALALLAFDSPKVWRDAPPFWGGRPSKH